MLPAFSKFSYFARTFEKLTVSLTYRLTEPDKICMWTKSEHKIVLFLMIT